MDSQDLKRIAGRVAGSTGTVRTAGKIEFIRDQGPLRRDIRAPGFKWSPESFNDLAKILWSSQRAHSYAMAALRIFSKLQSAQISPDGLLGGRGYIQSVKDMRASLGSAAEALSAFNDTVHDEISADHWNSVDSPEAKELVDDAEQVKSNPDAFVDSGYEEVQGPDTDIDEPLHNPTPDEMNPSYESDDESDDGGEEESGPSFEPVEGVQTAASNVGDYWLKGEVMSLANDGALRDQPDYSTNPKKPGSKTPKDTADQKVGKSEAEMTMNTTTMDHGSYASAVSRMLRSHAASSSLPVETLPGPRVEHIGPAAGGTEAGHFNWDDLWPSDDQCGEGLHSGVNESDRLLEDGAGDGVTGYDNPTDGDSTILQIAHSGYSWLPGSRNEKIMPYYDRNVTQEDIDWMVAHSDPDPIEKQVVQKPTFNNLWDAELI